MQRRMERMGAMGRGMDWEAGAALARRLLGWAALAGAMFLLCQARTALAAPFAMAFLAAGLLTGKATAALLAGCVAGALRGSIRDFDLRLPVGAAIALGGSIAWDAASPALSRAMTRDTRAGRALRRAASLLTGRDEGTFATPAPNRLARSPNGAMGAALAGLAVLVPGLALLGEGLSLPAAAEVTAASVAAVAATPFYMEALDGGLSPRRLTAEMRAGWWLMAAALCGGLARLSPALSACLGGALAMGLHPAGALAGAAFGGAAAVCAGEPRLVALLAAGGAAAQVCSHYNRPGRAAACGAAMLAAGLLMNLKPVIWAGALAGMALSALPLPGDWARLLMRLARPGEPGDPLRLAALERRRAEGKLRALGAAFGELAEGYLRPVTLPDEQALTRRLRGRLCAGCGDYGECWAGERNRGARLLCDLIARAAVRPEDAPVFEEGVTPELLRRCRRGRLLAERTEDLLEDFARTRRAELRRGAENRLVSAQFMQAQGLLEALAAGLARPVRRERPRLRVAHGAACASGRAGEMSGDSHLVTMLDERRLLALVSDGMGSGPAAAEESALAARLLGRFLRAGAGVGLAVETVNALLLNRGGEDMFATADILVLDLVTGEAELTKLAACPTFIARGGEALRVEGGRLPLGILERVRPEPVRTRLMPGDALLMVSDGVADAAGAGALEALLLDGAGEDPARLAERALDIAGDACEGGRRDDMTAVCLVVSDAVGQ